MSLSAAGLALANEQSGRRLSQLVLVAIGALGLAMSSQLVGAGGDLAGIEALATGPIRSPDASQVVVAGGWIGIGCALVAICLAVARPRGLGLWFVPAVATVPFALIGVLVAAVGYESFDLGNAGQSAGLPQVLTASSYVAPALLTAAKVVGFWLIPLALWQVVTWARASKREVGGALAARDAAWPWLLAALLTFKLGWLLLGYAGRLPTLLGGDAPTWKTVLDDGIPAWLLAALFASLAGWWLVSPRRIQVSERGFTPAALLVVLGFSAVTVAMSLAIVALPVAGLLPGTPLTQKLASACATNWRSEAIGNATKCLLDAATDHQFELTILVDLGTLVAAVVIAAWLWSRPRWRSTVLFLLTVVAWVAPRVPDALGALLGWPPRPSVAPELATVDTALTLVVAVLALGWYTGRQRSAEPPALILVLVVGTLLAHAGTVVPPGAATMLFFLALLFPIAYELLFDSEGVNRRQPDRPATVIESLAIRVGALSLVALGIAFGTLEPSNSGADQLGRVLFAAPFSALLVAATLSRHGEPMIEPVATVAVAEGVLAAQQSASVTTAAVPAPRIQLRTLLSGILGAAVALAVLVGIGAAVDPALASLGAAPAASPDLVASPAPAVSPTPIGRLAEFKSRSTRANGQIQDQIKRAADHLATGSEQLAVDGAALERLAADERDWLRVHPPADCYATAAHARDVEMDRVATLGQRIGAVTDVNDPLSTSAVIAALKDYNVADGAFVDSFIAAVSACGAGPP
jgi:hypothetical protein